MREPPITVTCECGEIAWVPYGDRWICPSCSRRWDTAQIPQGDYDDLLRSVRRYRLLAVGPPLVLAAVLIPAAILYGLQYGLLFFVLAFAYGVFVIPKLRERATKDMHRSTRSWELRPE